MTRDKALIKAAQRFLAELNGQTLPGDRPQFTPEEMAWLESLPKKQRKQAVIQLKEKYRSVK